MPNIKDITGLQINDIDIVDSAGELKHPDFTSLQKDVANKTIIPSTGNISILSESILGAGDFPTAIAIVLGGTVLTPYGSHGGSHIGTQLAEMCDEAYIHMNGENAFLYSNDMTNAAWSKDADITVTREMLSDRTVWNKVVKSSGAANLSLYQYPITVPANPTGVFMSLELYVPVGTTPEPITQLNLLCINTSKSNASVGQSFPNLVPGKRYKLIRWVELAQISTWEAGDQIRLRIQQNPLAPTPWSANTMYIRNAQLSFTAPAGFQNYVPTGAAAIAAGDSALTKIEKNNYYYRDVDVIVQSTGRNEAEAGIDKYVHHRAFDKLIAQCARVGQTIVVGNCPPKSTNGISWDINDPYETNDYHSKFLRLISKWNVPNVDIFQLLKDDVTAGNHTVDELKEDAAHQSTIGSTVMAEAYKSQITSRKILNSALPELRNSVRYYKSGTNTGAWVAVEQSNGIEARLIGGNAVAWVSSTQNDTIVFSDIECEQLHVLTCICTGYGTFSVIIDEGTAKEITLSINTDGTSASPTQNARFITDLLDAGKHTVKIKITSAAKPVKIYGIVAI